MVSQHVLHVIFGTDAPPTPTKNKKQKTNKNKNKNKQNKRAVPLFGARGKIEPTTQ